MSLFRRINQQFDSVGPWGRLVLVAYYVLGFVAIFFVAKWVADSLEPFNKAAARFIVGLFQ